MCKSELLIPIVLSSYLGIAPIQSLILEGNTKLFVAL